MIKLLKIIENDAGNNIDKIYPSLVFKGWIDAFDPPIVWHA